MTPMLRNLFSLLVLALLAIPAPGDETEGGENASGTGVWILPACAAVDPAQVGPLAPTRSTFVCNDMSKPVEMKVSAAMGCSSATMTYDVLGTPCALHVSGQIVRVSPAAMAALNQSPTKTATIIVSDAAQNGYVLTVKAVGTSVHFDLK